MINSEDAPAGRQPVLPLAPPAELPPMRSVQPTLQMGGSVNTLGTLPPPPVLPPHLASRVSSPGIAVPNARASSPALHVPRASLPSLVDAGRSSSPALVNPARSSSPQLIAATRSSSPQLIAATRSSSPQLIAATRSSSPALAHARASSPSLVDAGRSSSPHLAPSLDPRASSPAVIVGTRASSNPAGSVPLAASVRAHASTMPPRRPARSGADLGSWADKAADDARVSVLATRDRVVSWWEKSGRERSERARAGARAAWAAVSAFWQAQWQEIKNRDAWTLFFARARFRASLAVSWLRQKPRRLWGAAATAVVVAGLLGWASGGSKASPEGEREALALTSEENAGAQTSEAAPPPAAVETGGGIAVTSLPVLGGGQADVRFAVREPQSLPSCDAALGKPFRVESEPNRAMAASLWTRSRKSLMNNKRDRALAEMCQAAAWDLAGRGTYGLSEYYFQQSDFVQALAWAERVPNDSRRAVDARSMVGDIHNQLGHVEQSRRAFADAWNMRDAEDERRSVALRFVQSATKALRKGDWWTAERFYRRALTLTPQSADAAAGFARTLLHFGYHQTALGWAEEALKRDERSSLAALSLCEANIAMKDRDGARAALTRLRALAPEEPNLTLLERRIRALD